MVVIVFLTYLNEPENLITNNILHYVLIVKGLDLSKENSKFLFVIEQKP